MSTVILRFRFAVSFSIGNSQAADISCSTGSIIKHAPYTKSTGNTESRNDIFAKCNWVDLKGDNVILSGTNWKGQLGTPNCSQLTTKIAVMPTAEQYRVFIVWRCVSPT